MTTKGDRLSKVTTKGDRLSKVTTKGDRLSKVTTKGDRLSKVTTKGDRLSKVTTKGDRLSKVTTKGDRLFKVTILTAEDDLVCDICSEEYFTSDGGYIALTEWLDLSPEERVCDGCKKNVCPYCAMTCYTCYNKHLSSFKEKSAPKVLCSVCNKGVYTECKGCREGMNCSLHVNPSGKTSKLKCATCKANRNFHHKYS